MNDLIGRTIGPYEIKDVIGQGGMASVYRAYQTSLNRYVAIKVLSDWMSQDREFVQRFRQEALAAGALRHPNILHIHDAGTFENRHYIVMDYVATGTLARRMQGGPLPAQAAAELVAQVADALDHVHRRGIVHRDIKPSNILLDEEGRPLLADFGIAQAMSGGPRLTQTGASIGTPEYMSPEQAQGARVDGRSDIYSLGVVLYQMLSGRAPFTATTPVAVLYQVVNQPPPPLRQLNPKVPASLEAVVMRALAKRPEDRFAHAGEMAAALRGKKPVGAPPPPKPMLWPILAGVLFLVVAVTVALLASGARTRSGPAAPVQTPVATPTTASPATLAPTEALVAVLPSRTPAVTVIEKVVTATPAPSATPAPPTQTPVVLVVTATSAPATAAPRVPQARASQDANLRGGPGTGYAIVGQLRQGQQIELTGRCAASDWWQLTFEGKPAWVSSALLTLGEGTDRVPVAANIPASPTAASPAAVAGPAQPGVVYDFESFGSWKRGDEPYGTIEQTAERKHGGAYAAKLTYNFPPTDKNYVVFRLIPAAPIPIQSPAWTLWVYGDGSNHFLNAWILDAQGETRQFTFGQVAHRDSWQPMTLRLDVTAPWPQSHIDGPDNGRLDYPISLAALVFDAVPRTDVRYEGVIYLDDLTLGEIAPTARATAGPGTPAAPTAPPVSQPAGPLGGRIVFAGGNGASTDVVVVDVAGKNTWRLFSNARQPDVRKDGRVVLNGIGGGKDNLFAVNLDGSLEIKTGLHPEDAYPHWSATGQSAVLHSTLQGDGRDRIYIQFDMTHAEEPKVLQVNKQDVFGRWPTWLPSWRIAFTGCDYWAGGSHCGIWTVNSNGTGAAMQLTERSDDRSTDGANGLVLFSSQGTGNWDIYVIPENGGTPANLTNHSAQDAGGAFSPDGSRIAFMSNRDGGWGIWVMGADGSNPQKLIGVPNGFGAGWAEERLAWGP